MPGPLFESMHLMLVLQQIEAGADKGKALLRQGTNRLLPICRTGMIQASELPESLVEVES